MSRRLYTIVVVSSLALLAPTRARAQEAGIMLVSSAPSASVVTLGGRQVDLAISKAFAPANAMQHGSR